MKLNLKRLIPRAVHYFHIGYSRYLHFPITFLAFIYLIFDSLSEIFPPLKVFVGSFVAFLILSLISIPLAGAFLGYMHYKGKLKFLFRSEMDIHIESSPYTSEVVVPVELIIIKVIRDLAKDHGIDTTELDALIERSKRNYAAKKIKTD